MAEIVQVAASIQDVFSEVAHELAVILVFFVSLLLWKHIGERNKVSGARQQKASQFAQHPVAAKKVVAAARIAEVDAKGLQAIRAAEMQMMQLLEQREFTRALNFFRTFERDGRDRHFSEALFSAFIQSAIRVGKVDIVERLLRSMKAKGIESSREFWRTTLKMLSSRKHFEVCLSIAATFGQSLPADKVIFSCLINGALENGSPEHAATLLDRYREAPDLDPRDYILLFRTYVAVNDVDSAEKVFRELGSSMNSLMLNLLLLTCVKVQQPERALDRLHEACTMQDSRVSKDAAEAVPIVDVVSYNTVIKGFSQAGLLPRCFDCLQEMRSRNLEPDDVTFGTLLDISIADNDMNAANKLVDLLLHRDRPVDTLTCTLFIKGLVRAQKLTVAVELYEEMKKRSDEGSRPDIVTYSVLIKAFVDSRDLERALQLVEEMVAAGHRPDDIIFTHLMEGCCYVGNHALGKKLFDDMLASGVKPSDFTLITMLKLHGRCGAHNEAYQLVANWERQHGLKPSVIHYTCLMSGCLRNNSFDQAWQAYELMKSVNIQADETTLATLLPGMVLGQQWDRVLELAKTGMKSSPPVPIAAEILNSALSQMRATGTTLHALQLQTLMQEAGIRITARNARHPHT